MDVIGRKALGVAEEASPQTNFAYMNEDNDDYLYYNHVPEIIDQGDDYYRNLPWPQEKRQRVLNLLEQLSQSRRRAILVSIVIFFFVGGIFLLSLCMPESRQQNNNQSVQWPPFLFELLFVLCLLVPLIPVCFWMDHRSIHEELNHEVQRTFPVGAIPPRPKPLFQINYLPA